MAHIRSGRLAPALAASVLVVLLGASSALFGVCGPFTDVAADAFCPFVLEIFTLGITTGTSPTTYDPTSSVSRLQMAAFLSRSVDGVLKRGGRRAALDQFWTPQVALSLGTTTVGSAPLAVRSDGLDVWVANFGGSSITRVRGNDGRVLETWTGAAGAAGVAIAIGKVFVSGQSNPGQLYRIDPGQSAGAVTTVASNLGGSPQGIAFDGTRIWTANFLSSVSIVSPGASIPWTVTTVSTGFVNPLGMLYDGGNIWVTDYTAGTLLKLGANAAILQTVTVGSIPLLPIFDGANIWVPNDASSTISVVRASTGAVLATLTGNGLAGPQAAAFDGQRVLVANSGSSSVSLWKAADLTALGSFGTGTSTQPDAACSDGVNFWITIYNTNQLARF